ncbi:MAG: HPr family phosphocarrier protein [Deltaproteobacteria bacterium]|nr:HPr family phosphocarrier protein [Deltaproteobacteria bacterium]MBW2122985.1 HPr family phosphocarrier protein [Deltaproteobacteria bacterium]
MEEQTFVIKNRLGLHARAAGLMVRLANRYNAEISIEKDGMVADAKSIMGVMMLAAAAGSRVKIRAEGPDARKAIRAIGRLIDRKFGED